ncbi:MAG: putative lipoprotein [Phenylobacterium sp.]|nr:putative lipoprotein [Phenylobacterium sp.]
MKLLPAIAASVILALPSLAAAAPAGCAGGVAAIAAALAEGGKVNAVARLAEREESPLSWAVSCNNTEGATALLKAGANPNQGLRRHSDRSPGDYGDTPVLRAVEEGTAAMLRLLLDHGGDPNAAYDGAPGSALGLAADQGWDEAFQAFYAGNPSEESVDRTEPSGAYEKYGMLLDAGADINRVHGGRTIMDHLIGRRNYHKAIELVDRGYVNLVQVGYLMEQQTRGEQFRWNLVYVDALADRLKAAGVRSPVAANYTTEDHLVFRPR